jgi:hypothetical protein
MKKTLITAAALAALLPVSSYAKSHPGVLSLFNIRTIYIYSSFVHQNDATAQQEIAWLRQVVPDATGWREADSVKNSDAVLIVVPHGVGYQSGTSSSCWSGITSSTCISADGSSVRMDCGPAGCDSEYSAGHYLSLLVAIHVDGTRLKVIWRSGLGKRMTFAIALSGMHDDNPAIQHLMFKGAVGTLCKAAGVSNCGHVLKDSWKSVDSSGQGDGTFTLPQ